MVRKVLASCQSELKNTMPRRLMSKFCEKRSLDLINCVLFINSIDCVTRPCDSVVVTHEELTLACHRWWQDQWQVSGLTRQSHGVVVRETWHRCCSFRLSPRKIVFPVDRSCILLVITMIQPLCHCVSVLVTIHVTVHVTINEHY